MIIKIHEIKKFKNYWKVRFSSERNENAIEISTPVFDNYDKLIKHIEKYIEENIPIVEKLDIEKDSSEIVIEEPTQSTDIQVNEPTEAELQLQAMQDELNKLILEKDTLAMEIKRTLEDWKLDLDLINLKEEFLIDDPTYLQILEDKKNRKVAKYVELKTKYEDLKKLIKQKEREIQQFAEQNSLTEYLV